MKQIYTLVLWSLLFIPSIFSQPLPCQDPPSMTSTCLEACIICDIDGFQGRHDSDVMGEAPDGFCTIIVHNAQWIAFQAGSESLSIQLDVSNCVMGNGLEVAIYESFDCESFRQISNCRGGMNPVTNGSTGIFNTTEPLTVGQYYFLVMDGNFGDNCDWTFTVLEGSTQVDPLTTSGAIDGPSVACPGNFSEYLTVGEVGATRFEWQLNGTVIESEEEAVSIDWSADGVYELCVTASNVCDEAPPSCRTILVQTPPPAILDTIICEGEVVSLNDTTNLTEAGNYEFNYLDSENCDSTIFVNLQVVSASATDLSATICDGDTIPIGGVPYFLEGIHSEVLENYLGCDSIINLDLSLIICEIQGETATIPVVCNGEASGTLSFWVEDGTPPFSYSWERLGGPLNGSGVINSFEDITVLNDLIAGTYLITITDNFENDLILIEAITEPEVLSASFMSSNYNGWDISCFGASDGRLSVMPVGGFAPYTYMWSTGEQTQSITNVIAGNYAVQITDVGGCTINLERPLEEPQAIFLDALFSDPNCDGLETGEVQVLGISGGSPPYLFDLSGSGFSETEIYTGLSEGTYVLIAEDANGCQVLDSASLFAPVIPVIIMEEEQRVELGEKTTLGFSTNVPLDLFFWEESEDLSCTDCPEPEVLPLENSFYSLSITSEDGCITVDSTLVLVDKVRDVYIPNAFSPNGDGRNDDFYIFAGPEVAEVLTFNVFSRWGELLLEKKNIQPNEAKLGWDGTFLGEDMPTGIYTYFADITFIDGIQFQYKGSILLLR